MAIATYNVLNLDPNDADGDQDVANGQFAAIAAHIVNNLGRPDIIALQEVQDNDGSLNTGVTTADITLQMLIDAIVAEGGPTYSFLDNPFIGDDTSGGQPGGNIRTAYLFNPDRVDFVEGSLATITDPTDQQTNPDSPFFDTRLPLVATFTFNGQEVTLINNHFSSKGGSSPLFGQNQPPWIPAPVWRIRWPRKTRSLMAVSINDRRRRRPLWTIWEPWPRIPTPLSWVT